MAESRTWQGLRRAGLHDDCQSSRIRQTLTQADTRRSDASAVKLLRDLVSLAFRGAHKSGSEPSARGLRHIALLLAVHLWLLPILRRARLSP